MSAVLDLAMVVKFPNNGQLEARVKFSTKRRVGEYHREPPVIVQQSSWISRSPVNVRFDWYQIIWFGSSFPVASFEFEISRRSEVFKAPNSIQKSPSSAQAFVEVYLKVNAVQIVRRPGQPRSPRNKRLQSFSRPTILRTRFSLVCLIVPSLVSRKYATRLEKVAIIEWYGIRLCTDHGQSECANDQQMFRLLVQFSFQSSALDLPSLRDSSKILRSSNRHQHARVYLYMSMSGRTHSTSVF